MYFKCVDLSTLTEEQRLNVHETELNTIIDPFQVPFPWVRRTKANGEVVYVNEETKAVKSKQPGEVRREKRRGGRGGRGWRQRYFVTCGPTL